MSEQKASSFCYDHFMWQFEKHYQEKGYSFIAGVDEAGRGPLAGPVVAAACFLEPDETFLEINDSKKLSSKKRKELFDFLIHSPKVRYGIGIVEPVIIDEINILQATMLAMKNAVENLPLSLDLILVDGNRTPKLKVLSQAIVKGDSKSLSIAAASIIAKETRDLLMLKYHERYPEYGFNKHMGYGTRLHKEALQEFGPCPIHRKSFSPVSEFFQN